ncbi:helix-turn-helix domain-containing protein [Candidatus Micrarchaeota archaeon]|nr:helix-turn-helix domain-containing protein [Candidatus Micrarchaeota archaeon]MBU1930507.1 helix-turn-helix domain-containing protein [Candidatus Micrarchaeota archaeon]
MWVAEFKVWHKGSPLLPLSEQMDVHMFSQYLNTFEEKGKPKIMRMAVFWGKDKENAIKELYKHTDSEVIFRESDQLFFSQNATRSFHTMVSDKNVFFLGPILEEKGFQWWKVGSNKKENLLRFFERIKQQKGFATIELLSIKDKKIGLLSFSKMPELDERDLEWWKKALQEGYYQYPRKASLEELSKKMGIPYSTLKDHLRKTESFLMRKIGREL